MGVSRELFEENRLQYIVCILYRESCYRDGKIGSTPYPHNGISYAG